MDRGKEGGSRRPRGGQEEECAMRVLSNREHGGLGRTGEDTRIAVLVGVQR